MSRANVIIGSLFFLMALLMFVFALDFPKPQVSGLSPRVFPQFVAVCTMICSGLLIIRNVRELMASRGVSTKKKSKTRLLSPVSVSSVQQDCSMLC